MTTKHLPDFVSPMLAKIGRPFDSPDHIFEIKWDGTRALAFVDAAGLRLLNRRRARMLARYPELEPLAELPRGIVLDGEIVVLRDGKPDFGLLQSREHTRSALRIRTLARSTPVTYIVFDLLYRDYRPLFSRPLLERRDRLREAVAAAGDGNRLVFSESVATHGERFFEETCRQGLEGVMAKHVRSRYLPGKRSDAWLKIKRTDSIQCAIIGFVPSGKNDFRSLIIASHVEGELRCVGKVGSGIDEETRDRLNQLLRTRLRDAPLVACTIRGKWVEPGLYCTVSYLERTRGGELRAPVFKNLIVE